MINLFDSPRMAAGYARARPAVHPHVIERIRNHLRIAKPFRRALDVGCGAGLSTAPLKRLAEQPIGIEPSEAMLKWSWTIAPDASFMVGAAEALPIRSHSVEIVTAAGSLNWADLGQFFPEVRRVLTPDGTLVIYDFGPGRDFRGSDRLAEWNAEFNRRYPPPPCLEIGPENLVTEPYGLQISGHQYFEVGLSLTPAFYLEYAMTETNVAEAVRTGVPEQEIRNWCESTLASVFQGAAREVLFHGYIAYLVST